MKGERDGRKNVDWEGVRGERKGGREKERNERRVREGEDCSVEPCTPNQTGASGLTHKK